MEKGEHGSDNLETQLMEGQEENTQQIKAREPDDKKWW